MDFEASVPSFEAVAATNKAATAIFNKSNNEFAALVLIKGFRFKNALMEEHFNENYAESDTYPKATFKGLISNSLEKQQIDGELTFHGKTKLLSNIPITLIFEDDVVKMSGSFILNASDFNIKIPKIIRNKVSETVKVSLEFNMKKQ